MNWTRGKALLVLAVAVAAVTAGVSVLTGNPVASYVFNRNFAVGTAAMVVGVMLIWHQHPEEDAAGDPDEDPIDDPVDDPDS